MPESMFGNFESAKKRKAPPWAGPVLGAALAFHIIVFVTMWVKSIWDIESLDHPKSGTDIAIAPPPPPPPPPPKGGAKPQEVQLQPKKIKVKDIVQPVKIEKQEPQKVEEVGQVDGEEGGVEGGQVGGVVGGDLSGVVQEALPPPPPPAPPQIIAPNALEQQRIAGEKQIHPDDVTKTEIQRSGKDKVVGGFKVCITAGGDIANVTQVKSTGFPAYDNKILSTIKREWRYRPFNVNGKNVPVCTAVTFFYVQK